MPGLETLTDLCTPWCIHVVATLRIANRIAAGTDRIEALASEAGCDPFVLHCVLGHLVWKGVFAEPEPGRFALTEASQGLLDPMMSIGLDLNGIGGRMAHAWSTLLSYTRTGKPAYHEVFGRGFWEDLEANPEIAASFDALIGPAGHGHFSPEVPLTTGWESVRTVADVGGGTGAMLTALLRAHPHLRGILVDLPGTVARAGGSFREAGIEDRVSLAPQSFFDALPAGADIYLLRGILNDWPDHEAIAILRRCAEAARPNGRVVVLKSVGADSTPKRLFVEMVLAGGRPRTVTEFRDLAHDAGLEIVAAGKHPDYFVVECRPVG